MSHDLRNIISKALDYIPELGWRVKQVDETRVCFEGRHDRHLLERKDDLWICSCHTFASFALAGGGTCAHSFALMYREREWID